MKNTDFTEQWAAMQKMTSAISAPLRENARRFWENQDKLLDSMQNSCEWLVRRVSHRNSRSARSRRTYVRNPDIRRSDSGVSELGRRSI